MKILVVDDSTVNLLVYRKTLATCLPEAEYRELAAPTEVFGLASHWQPDVILLDYHMPGMDGLSVTRQLKADAATANIPIIIITAQQSTPALRISCLEQGADAFLQKPIDSAELVAQIKVMARIKDMESKLRREQKALEKLLTERSKELNQFRDFFIPLLDNFPALIWRAGIDAKCDWFNKTWLDFTGRSMEQEMGDGWAEGVHPEDLQRCVSIYLTSFEQRKPFVMEYRLRHHDSSWRILSDHGAPFYGPDGTFIGYIGSCYDITGQRHLEEQLRHSQKLEAIGTLAGGVAHDFNNILTVILGYGSMLQLQLPADSPHAESVGMIVDSAKRASNLTQRLLAFSRKQESNLKTESLCELFENFEKFLKRVIGEDISMVVTCTDHQIKVSADRNLLEQALMNLTVNARDAMPDGGHIIIQVDQLTLADDEAEQLDVKPGPYARITFQDTGLGIPSEIHTKIFDPFFTTKEIGKGSGLGLSMVYGIIRQHHGAITVSSVPGKGTSFTILLPITTGNAAQQQPTAFRIQGGSETILLVEDEAAVRGTTAAVLKQYGYQLIEVEDGMQALQAVSYHGNQIKLVLMDMIMPGLNGWDTAELIKKQLPELPILFMSGYTDDIITSRGIDVSGIDMLMKPVYPEELLAKIRAMLLS